MEIKEINLESREGKLLWAALIEMSTGFYANYTPTEILSKLDEVFNKCHPTGNQYKEGKD